MRYLVEVTARYFVEAPNEYGAQDAVIVAAGWHLEERDPGAIIKLESRPITRTVTP